jgi:hypothetical protein
VGIDANLKDQESIYGSEMLTCGGMVKKQNELCIKKNSPGIVIFFLLCNCINQPVM